MLKSKRETFELLHMVDISDDVIEEFLNRESVYATQWSRQSYPEKMPISLLQHNFIQQSLKPQCFSSDAPNLPELFEVKKVNGISMGESFIFMRGGEESLGVLITTPDKEDFENNELYLNYTELTEEHLEGLVANVHNENLLFYDELSYYLFWEYLVHTSFVMSRLHHADEFINHAVDDFLSDLIDESVIELALSKEAFLSGQTYKSDNLTIEVAQGVLFKEIVIHMDWHKDHLTIRINNQTEFKDDGMSLKTFNIYREDYDSISYLSTGRKCKSINELRSHLILAFEDCVDQLEELATFLTVLTVCIQENDFKYNDIVFQF